MSIPPAAADAAQQFIHNATPFELFPLGDGLINDTFRVDVRTGESFVLQRINPRVFADPLAILGNYRTLLDHLDKRPKARPSLRIPRLLDTRTGEICVHDAAGDVWRAQEYLSGTRTLHDIGTPAEAEAVGTALGRFHGLFADLPPDRLKNTLPGFHVTPAYLEHYDRIRSGIAPIPADSRLEQAMAWVEAGRERVSVLETARERGDLKVRVTHGDPKLDNLLFDRAEVRVVSLIDLDTVKAGLAHHDLGDCLRSCCGRKNPGEPAFDLKRCIPLLQAYHAASLPFTPARERGYWYEAIRLIPYELGLRFLTDHLAGNPYFKVTYPEQNLHRALEQFRIAESVEQQKDQLLRVIDELASA